MSIQCHFSRVSRFHVPPQTKKQRAVGGPVELLSPFRRRMHFHARRATSDALGSGRRRPLLVIHTRTHCFTHTLGYTLLPCVRRCFYFAQIINNAHTLSFHVHRRVVVVLLRGLPGDPGDDPRPPRRPGAVPCTVCACARACFLSENRSRALRGNEPTLCPCPHIQRR